MSKPQEELKQRLLTHMSKDYPNSKRALEDITDEESEMLDSTAEFINSEVRASLDRLISTLPYEKGLEFNKEYSPHVNRGIDYVKLKIETERQSYE